MGPRVLYYSVCVYELTANMTELSVYVYLYIDIHKHDMFRDHMRTVCPPFFPPADEVKPRPETEGTKPSLDVTPFAPDL